MNHRFFRPCLLVVLLVCLASGLPHAASAAELSVPEIVSRVRPAVVLIESRTDNKTAVGSGFIVDPSGIIVTNVHVIKGATTVHVKLSNGDVYDLAQVLVFDERRDTALIKIPAFALPAVRLGNSDQVVIGEKVILVGNPLGRYEGSVTSGIVSGIRTTREGSRVIQTDAAANPGNSGGPLLNEKGEAIGILSFKATGAENLNFVIPINYARGMLGEKVPLTLKEFNEKLAASSTPSFENETRPFPKIWKITSTGRNLTVRLNGGHVYMEAVGSPAWKAAGGFMTADLKKDGSKYVGVVRTGRPCRYRDWWGKSMTRVCTANHGMEVSLLSPERIEGIEEESKKIPSSSARTALSILPDLRERFRLY